LTGRRQRWPVGWGPSWPKKKGKSFEKYAQKGQLAKRKKSRRDNLLGVLEEILNNRSWATP